MKKITLDDGTCLELSDDQYAVVRAYANLFCKVNLACAVKELARKKPLPRGPKNVKKQVT